MKAEALAVAKEADVIVAALGETADMSGECASRTDLCLPDVQMELLQELNKLGKPIVLLNFSGRPTVMNWENENIPAILNVWFGGSEAADAICDVVFGDKVPSGKLTMSMPQAVGRSRSTTTISLPDVLYRRARGVPQVSEQLSRCAQRPSLSVRIRPVIHHIQLLRPATQCHGDVADRQR